MARTNGCAEGLTQLQQAEHEDGTPRKEGEQDGHVCAEFFDVRLRHQCHYGRGSYVDVLAAAEYCVDEAAHDSAVQTVLGFESWNWEAFCGRAACSVWIRQDVALSDGEA